MNTSAGLTYALIAREMRDRGYVAVSADTVREIHRVVRRGEEPLPFAMLGVVVAERLREAVRNV